MTSNQGSNVGMTPRTLMRLEPEDLNIASEAADSNTETRYTPDQTCVHHLLILLTQCISVTRDKDAPTPCMEEGQSEFMSRVRTETPEAWSQIDAWGERVWVDGTDELLFLMMGEDTHRRIQGLNHHINTLDSYFHQRYGTVYTERMTSVFPHSARALMDCIKRNDTVLVSKIAVILNALATETAVHKYFMGIDPSGVISTPRVNTRKYAEFMPYLKDATHKFRASVRPFTNAHAYVVMCVWRYFRCSGNAQ